MAEFLVAAAHHKGYAIGDVITIHPDGWGWTRAELPSVVKLPAIAYSKALHRQCKEPDFERFVFLDKPRLIEGASRVPVSFRDRAGVEFRNTNDEDLKVKTLDRATWAIDEDFSELRNVAGEAMPHDVLDVDYAKRRVKLVGAALRDKVMDAPL